MDQARNANARTHLANERTFLAWIRTGLTIIALGIAGAHFLEEMQFGGLSLTKMLTVSLVGLGAGIAALGWVRYRRTTGAIEDGDFQPDVTGIQILLLGVAVIAALGLLIAFSAL